MKIKVHEIEGLKLIAEEINRNFGDERVFVLNAEMGLGKTTFITYFCENILKVQSEVSSPTFAIINEYLGEKDLVYHFDFYRLETLEEALDIGFDEYIYSGNYCFIEWPDIIKALLPEHYVQINITYDKENENVRVFDIFKV